MSVSATEAYSLCEKTGLPPDLCRLTLERSHNDPEEAMAVLKRWKLLRGDTSSPAVAIPATQKFSLITTAFNPDTRGGAIVEARCGNLMAIESKEYVELLQDTADEIAWYEEAINSVSDRELLEKAFSTTIEIKSIRFAPENSLSLITTYNHRGHIAAILETEVFNEDAFNCDAFRTFSFNCALHIIVNNPLSVSKETIPEELKVTITNSIEKELLKNGKSIFLWPEIIKGKLNKWGEQNSLLGQPFIKNDKETVEEVRKRVSEQINSDIRINRFARISI